VLLLPYFSAAQPPTATVVVPVPGSQLAVGGFGDEQDAVLIPRHNAFSATVQTSQPLVGVMGEEQPTSIPYVMQAAEVIVTHGTSLPPVWTVAVCEDAEPDGGDWDAFLVNQFVWEASPQPARKITHVTRDQTGAILGTAAVKLFRTSNDKLLETEISDPTTGAFTLSVFDAARYYYTAVRADAASSTRIRASSSTVKASSTAQIAGIGRNDMTGS
jgi:hypothetical protein